MMMIQSQDLILKFSTEDSSEFLNVVLRGLHEDLKKDDRLIEVTDHMEVSQKSSEVTHFPTVMVLL